MVKYSADGKTAFYCGYKFRKDGKTGYYLCSKNTDLGKRERLHSFVWRMTNNKSYIPSNCHIHHIDGDKDNNEPANLRLMTAREHEAYHADNVSEQTMLKKRDNLLKNAIPAASVWHRSQVGRDWHKQHGVKAYSTRVNRIYLCNNCGCEFQTRHIYSAKSNKFCSNNCKVEYRRKSGVDNIDRICQKCGETFKCNKYSPTKFCSKCGNKKRRA